MLYPGKERTSEKCFSIHLTLPFLFEFIRQISEFVSKQNISGISQESAVLQSCRDCKRIFCVLVFCVENQTLSTGFSLLLAYFHNCSVGPRWNTFDTSGIKDEIFLRFTLNWCVIDCMSVSQLLALWQINFFFLLLGVNSIKDFLEIFLDSI